MTDQCIQDVTSGLVNYGWQPLWVHKEEKDILIQGIRIQICTATVSTAEMAVFDAFILTGGGLMTCINTTTFPDFKDVLSYHMGKLVVEGTFKIVNNPDGPGNG